MATDSSKSGKETAPVERTPQKLVMLELEEALEGVRAALVTSLATALREKDEKKIEDALIRYGLCAAPEQAGKAVISALGVRPASHASILETLRMEMTAFLSQGNGRWRPAISAILSLQSRILLLSSLPEEASRSLVSRMGVGENAVLVGVPLTEAIYPSPDLLRRVAREAGVSAAQTTMLVSCRSSYKSALLAGFRCVVAPDRYTAHQDFSGADAVFDVDSPPARAELAEAL